MSVKNSNNNISHEFKNSNNKGIILYNIDYNIYSATGNLSIFSNPPGAEIFIDGVDKNMKTNDIVILPEGTYEVKLVLNNYIPWIGNFEVIGGQTQVSYSINESWNIIIWRNDRIFHVCGYKKNYEKSSIRINQ